MTFCLALMWLGLQANYLGVCSNYSFAFFARMCKLVFVAFDAVRMLISKDVPMTSQVEVTVKTSKMIAVPVLIHCLCVFTGEYQLNNNEIRTNCNVEIILIKEKTIQHSQEIPTSKRQYFIQRKTLLWSII